MATVNQKMSPKNGETKSQAFKRKCLEMANKAGDYKGWLVYPLLVGIIGLLIMLNSNLIELPDMPDVPDLLALDSAQAAE